MKRRDFFHLCTSAALLATAATQAPASGAARFKRYAPAELLDHRGKPLTPDALEVGVNYLFHYPYKGTPALLLHLPADPTPELRLRTADYQDYRWPGGVGPNGRIVAFCAICPHQLSTVFRQAAIISYQRHKTPVSGRDNTITCCAHHSVFDPLRGGAVMSGPAPQPLTAIVLEQDKYQRIFALGTLGGELFDEFFRAYRRELIREYGRGVARAQTAKTATVTPLKDYTQSVVRC